MNFEIPSYIVHYSRSEPFRSISWVPNSQLGEVISGMNSGNTWGLDRFSCNEYLRDRLDVESRLRDEFKNLGGKPLLNNPIYFFLGRNFEFERNEQNTGYAIQLSEISSEHVSLTYGDSMISFVEGNRSLMGEKYKNPLCKKIFCLESMQSIFLDENYPLKDPLHIEVQLWAMPDSSMVVKL